MLVLCVCKLHQQLLTALFTPEKLRYKAAFSSASLLLLLLLLGVIVTPRMGVLGVIITPGLPWAHLRVMDYPCCISYK